VRRLWLAVFAVVAGVGTYYALSLFPSDAMIYDKDFGQEYLLARAIRAGVDPYQPIRDLAALFVQATSYLDKEHPTPHPPTVGLLALPLGYLSYPVAVRTWFVFEMVCLVAVVILLISGARLPFRVRIAPVLALALVAWAPITLELGLGQLMLPLLLGLAGAQLALLRGRSVLGGALLAITLLIKPIAWPWLIVLAWRRDFRALAATAGVALFGGIATVIAIGVDSTSNYFFHVLPLMSAGFFREPTNMSLWTVAPRLGLAMPNATLAVVVLLAATWIALRRRRLGDALGLATVASLLTSPIMWYFYLTLALLPLGQVVAAITRRGLRASEIAAAVCVFVLLSVSQEQLIQFARAGAGAGILMEPALGLILLGILLAWLTRESLV
jgi:hypothetical protein